VHVDVVARGAARAVLPSGASLDHNALRRTNRLTELASDAALFAVGIPAQSAQMLAKHVREHEPQ
jgi:hypothetical protein